MKFRFPNGCSISLWADEFIKLTVTASSIRYLTPGGQWNTIEVPSEWIRSTHNANESNRDAERPSPIDTPNKAVLAEKEKNNIALQSTPDRPLLTDSSENLSQLMARVAELTSQVEKYSKQDTKEQEFIRFQSEFQNLKEQVDSTKKELRKTNDIVAGLVMADLRQETAGKMELVPESQSESNPGKKTSSEELEKKQKDPYRLDLTPLYESGFRPPWQSKNGKKKATYKYGDN